MGTPIYNDPIESANSWESLGSAVEEAPMTELVDEIIDEDIVDEQNDVNATESH